MRCIYLVFLNSTAPPVVLSNLVLLIHEMMLNLYLCIVSQEGSYCELINMHLAIPKSDIAKCDIKLGGRRKLHRDFNEPDMVTGVPEM